MVETDDIAETDKYRVLVPILINSNINIGKDIEKLVISNKSFEKDVNNAVLRFQTIDVSITMNKLGNIGELILVAYAGSKGFPCSQDILGILAKYQTLIKNSTISTNSFVNSCTTAINNHKKALKFILKETNDDNLRLKNTNTGIKLIGSCSSTAAAIVEEASQLVDESTKLAEMTTCALMSAQKDENVSTAEKKNIQASIDESKSREAGLKTMVDSLEKRIKEANEVVADLTRKANSEGNKQFAMLMINSLVSPLLGVASSVVSAKMGGGMGTGFPSNNDLKPNPKELDESVSYKVKMEFERKKGNLETKIQNLKNELKDLEKKEETKEIIEQKNKTKAALDKKNKDLLERQKAFENNNKSNNGVSKEFADVIESLNKQIGDIRNSKFKLESEETAAKSELATLGHKLQTLKLQDNDLSAALVSLNITLKALGQIKTIFEQVKQYWSGVRDQCKNLKNITVDSLKDYEDDQDDLLEQIYKSGIDWMALGKLNFITNEAISKSDKKTDGILNNLPTKEEASKIIKNDTERIINSLVK